MIGLVLRRLALMIPTMFVVSVIMFFILMVGPNPLEQLKQNPNFRPEDIARLEKQYGWDKSVPQQYAIWAGNFVTGDFGKSLNTGRSAKETIAERLPLTLMLTGWSMLISLLIAIPIGSYIALKKYSFADYSATFLTFVMMAAPSFFIGLLLQLAALKLQDMNGGNRIFYTGGAPSCATSFFCIFQAPIEFLQRMALPIIALSLLQVAGWSRYMRSELLTVLNADYIKSATAKGIPGKQVFIKHAMRNSMLPIVTIVALDIALLFSGAVITESVFGLPGMGNLFLYSIQTKDAVVALAITMISVVLVLIMNTVADLAYGALDPRVRTG
jgi:peptide/nickel transport system permease protein